VVLADYGVSSATGDQPPVQRQRNEESQSEPDAEALPKLGVTETASIAPGTMTMKA
jgi:hypothetical protein